MYTEESDYTREATEIVVEFLDITYAKAKRDNLYAV